MVRAGAAHQSGGDSRITRTRWVRAGRGRARVVVVTRHRRGGAASAPGWRVIPDGDGAEMHRARPEGLPSRRRRWRDAVALPACASFAARRRLPVMVGFPPSTTLGVAASTAVCFPAYAWRQSVRRSRSCQQPRRSPRLWRHGFVEGAAPVRPAQLRVTASWQCGGDHALDDVKRRGAGSPASDRRSRDAGRRPRPPDIDRPCGLRKRRRPGHM